MLNDTDTSSSIFSQLNSTNNEPLDISISHENDGEIVVKYNFSVKPLEVYSKCTNPLNGSLSKNVICDFFVNCDGQIRDVDLLHTLVYSQLENTLLILVVVNSTSHYFTNEDNYYTFLQLYYLNFDPQNPENIQNNSLNLLSLFPIKSDYCVQLKWLQVNYDTGFLFAVLLFKSGKVKIARFNVNSLSNLFKTNQIHQKVLELEFVWGHTQNVTYTNKINCFDISYKVVESLITLVCGTNDGFLLIWDFNLNLFNSKTNSLDSEDVVEVDSEVVNSFKTLAILTGVNNTLVYRGILSLNFIPFPNSFILSIGTFSKGIILWDIRCNCDGELRTYNNITKPVNKVSWSRNSQYLFGCTYSGLCIDWQNNPTAMSINSTKLTKEKTNSVWENICRSADSSDDTLSFVFDSGEHIQLLTSNLNKRNMYNGFTLYKWNLIKPQNDEVDVNKCSDSMIGSLNYSMKNRFIKDLNYSRKVGISIRKFTSSSNSYNMELSDQNPLKPRSKIFSLNTYFYIILHLL
uniref:WD domain, G-beta repeat n=1 Tax=Theileria annulata TaxID=5874 RepID=A0A3B0N0F9_THEAN